MKKIVSGITAFVFLCVLSFLFGISHVDAAAPASTPHFVVLPECAAGEHYTLNAFPYAAINIIYFIFSISGSIALLLFIWGGFQWLTSAGASDRVEAGQNTMRNVLFGLFIMFFAWILVNYAVALMMGRSNDATAVKLFEDREWHRYENLCR